MLADNYLFVMGGALFLLFLMYLMFAYPNYIPHVLVATYFFLPLVYGLTKLQPLPLTTVFTMLLGPIVLWRSRKTVLWHLWPVAIYLLLVGITSFLNNIQLLENKSAFIPIIIATLCLLSFSGGEDAPKRFLSFTWVILGWIVVNSIFSILQMAGGQRFYLISATKKAGVVGGKIQRGYGLIGMATLVGINYCLGVPLSGAFLFDMEKRRKILHYTIFALCLAGLLLSFSRGAIFGVFLSLSILLFLRKRIMLLVVYLLLAITLVGTYQGVMSLLPSHYSNYFQGKDKSAGGRMSYVQIGLRMFADRPVTGFGFGGFSEQCIHYGSPIKLEAHNTYIQVLVEYGIFGLPTFLFMIAMSAKGYIDYIRKGCSETLCTLSIGYFAALIALVVNALVHCMEWNLIFWLPVIFGYLMRHYLIAEQHEHEDQYA